MMLTTTPLSSIAASSSGAPRPKHRVYLVEDHPITRQGLAALIGREFDLEVCGETDSPTTALAEIATLAPDVALVDVTLPATSGIEVAKQLQALRPDMPVLMMSMHDESLFAERALRAGARGYIMKLESGPTILAAIRRALAGELHLSEKMKQRMLQRLAHGGKTEIVFSIDSLSAREMEVFQLIGNGFSTRQIAAKLNLSVKTIDSYREHLKIKLRLENGVELVRHAIQFVKSESLV